MYENFTIRFWGVRGSHPAPGKNTIRYGGNTSCVEARAGRHVIILDAGTGIIPLGQQLAREKQLEATLLLSHLHHDHTQGFPFFVPAYISGACLHIYGPGAATETLERVLDTNQSAQTFPVGLNEMNAAKDIRSLKETDVLTFDSNGLTINAAFSGSFGSAQDEAVTVKIYRSYAHPGSVYVYRIEYHGRALVYATDIEGYVGGDKRLAAFARGADVLIHDAQYTEEHYYGQLAGVRSTQGFGHSTPQMACELAASARTRELVLFHHEPIYGDDMVAGMETRARVLFPNTRSAYEGLTMDVGIAKSFANMISVITKTG
ncbi:MAG: MBL fold metallo-hydrolase [Anaerolineales bacterium]|nr:MBL fold metallo-hydrolase [Anaerolineales bacterium]